MRAVDVIDSGGADVLRVIDVPVPHPAEGEVSIRVTAAGVNRADILQRMGRYAPPPGTSPILGLEVSGVVSAVTADDCPWSEGDEVCALLTGGGYAEQVVVPRGQVMPIPAGVDLVSAAGLPEVACTVYSNLAMGAGLRRGEWLLVHGGGSGIGTFAIQWAKAIGAQVAVTAGSAAKLRRCADLGADVLINYRDEDFVDRISAATDGHGADVILDVVGAKYLAANVAALADDGRLVVIGLQGGVKAELDLNALLRKRASIAASSLRARPPEEKADICTAVVREVWPLVAEGAIRPVIDRVVRLADVADAHEAMERSDHTGKILLRVDG